MAGNLDRKLELPHIHFRVLLHAAHMRHGTNSFTSLLKEGMLRIFLPWKIQRLWPGLNLWTWVPNASTLPLDHQSCWMNQMLLAVTSKWNASRESLKMCTEGWKKNCSSSTTDGKQMKHLKRELHIALDMLRSESVVLMSASKWNARWGSSLHTQHDEEEGQWYWWWQAGDMPKEGVSEHMQHCRKYEAMAPVSASKLDSRCSCMFIMSSTLLLFLYTYYNNSLLVSWAWQNTSMWWLWSCNPGEYSRVVHLTDLHPSQLHHSVCTNKTHSNFHWALLLSLKKILLWTDLTYTCFEHGLYSFLKNS